MKLPLHANPRQTIWQADKGGGARHTSPSPAPRQTDPARRPTLEQSRQSEFQVMGHMCSEDGCLDWERDPCLLRQRLSSSPSATGMSMVIDWLGRVGTKQEARQVFHELSRKWHPDKCVQRCGVVGGSFVVRDVATRIQQKLNRAYEQSQKILPDAQPFVKDRANSMPGRYETPGGKTCVSQGGNPRYASPNEDTKMQSPAWPCGVPVSPRRSVVRSDSTAHIGATPPTSCSSKSSRWKPSSSSPPSSWEASPMRFRPAARQTPSRRP